MKTKTQLSALVLIITMMFASSTFANNKSFDFEEESYIDDIPFNTEWVVSELMTLSYDFEDEDITFNTAHVVANYNYRLSTEVVFEIEEKDNINDIPFNSEWIANELLSEPVDFEEESYVDDIPFDTKYISETIAFRYALSMDHAYVYLTFW